MQLFKLSLLMLSLAVLGGCGPYLSYSSVDKMVEYQRHISSHTDHLFPTGSSRGTILARYSADQWLSTRTKLVGSVSVPFDQPVTMDFEVNPKTIRDELPFMLEVARAMSDKEIKRVDVFTRWYGAMYFGTNGYYVFYDDQGRVLVALRSAWS